MRANKLQSNDGTLFRCEVLLSKMSEFHFLQVVTFDGGEYVSMAGEFNDFRKVDFCCHNSLFSIHNLLYKVAL